MSNPSHPFAVPAKLESGLARVSVYWSGLRRADNNMPFGDDLDLPKLRELEDRLMLIEVFEQPLRFRFNIVGKKIREAYGADLAGKFSDEIEMKGPLAYFAAQASATIEAREPTYYGDGVKRLLLPMWGDGHIASLLGVIGV